MTIGALTAGAVAVVSAAAAALVATQAGPGAPGPAGVGGCDALISYVVVYLLGVVVPFRPREIVKLLNQDTEEDP